MRTCLVILALAWLCGCRAAPAPMPSASPVAGGTPLPGALASPSPAPSPTPFEPPGAAAREAAVGPLSPEEKPLYSPTAQFSPIPRPGPLDWLTSNSEEGQTFQEFRDFGPNRPTAERRVLYLQPLAECTDVAELESFTRAFFQLPVRVRAKLGPGPGIHRRINRYTHHPQLRTGDVLDLLAANLPADAFCQLGITSSDLYPSDTWNFVFGQGTLKNRVGIYSFARFDPAFLGARRPADWKRTRLRRSCQILAHEAGHMFGMDHCIYYRCVMNGSNSLEESDSQPLFLCPVCLRKLQWSIGFDVRQHYRDQLAFYRRHRFEPEAAWVSERLKSL